MTDCVVHSCMLCRLVKLNLSISLSVSRLRLNLDDCVCGVCIQYCIVCVGYMRHEGKHCLMKAKRDFLFYVRWEVLVSLLQL